MFPEIADPSKRPDSVEWWRKIQKQQHDDNQNDDNQNEDAHPNTAGSAKVYKQQHQVQWRLVCQSWEYTPVVEDVGKVLRVNLMVNGKPYVDFSTPVIPHPTTPSPRPWKRVSTIRATPNRAMKKFRILTWNTLADAASSRKSFKEMCPGWALQWTYRKENLLKHITAYDADIICIQEVDKKYWNNHWKNSFQNLGYDGEYGGSTTYGCAIFYRTSVFRKVRHEVLNLSQSAINWTREMQQKCTSTSSNANTNPTQNTNKSHTKTKLYDDQCRALKCGRKAMIFELERVGFRSGVDSDDVVQSSQTHQSSPLAPPPSPQTHQRRRMQDCDGDCDGDGENKNSLDTADSIVSGSRRLFVATCHLYKSDTRPWPFIRLLQAHVVMERLQVLARGHTNPKIIVAGDFNSGPETSIYRYMNRGSVRVDDSDIKGCAVIPCDLWNPFPLDSAYKRVLGHEQRYRRKHHDQTPVVEYVWCSSMGLRPLGVVPIPTDAAKRYSVEEISSDHQPLVVDMLQDVGLVNHQSGGSQSEHDTTRTTSTTHPHAKTHHQNNSHKHKQTNTKHLHPDPTHISNFVEPKPIPDKFTKNQAIRRVFGNFGNSRKQEGGTPSTPRGGAARKKGLMKF
mmetsp:Transcript_1535/g.2609  ORF Transcript_1535/g.2609 Transcript_1535/m.2609 type:complete len:621 (-) Transcript_1535:266-2128(-)